MGARHFILMSVAFLSACGDSSQQNAREDASRPEAETEFFSDVKNPIGLVPLASDYLKTNTETVGNSMVLEDIRLSSSLGHLSENIQANAEALGLTGFFQGFGLTGAASTLPEGLSWESSSPRQPLDFAAPDPEQGEGTIAEMQLKLGDVPIHNARVKMVVERGETTWVSGSRPSWLSSSTRPNSSPFALSPDQARQYAARELSFPEWRFHSPSKIYIAEKLRARAAYLFTVSAEHIAGERAPWIPLEIAVDADNGQILWQRPLAMHASATTQLHIENKAVSANTETVTLPDMLNSTQLRHNLFDVYNCNRTPRYLESALGNNCQQRATASGGTFSVSYSSNDYDDLVAYAGITRAMEKFRTLDESSLRSDWDQNKWPGPRSSFGLESGTSGGAPKRLMVFVNTETESPTTNACGKNTTPDNAQYVWQGRTGNGNPEIIIGYGGYSASRCGVFQDLGKDMDVVMHEFGHHLVFRGLSNTKPQSVALHEGYADYLTYAVTGNNFLAESVYPGRTSLRNGTTRQRTYSRFSRRSDGSYISVSQALNMPHAVGELWSGILWEMRQALGRDASNSYIMDKIVWDSIDLIKNDGEIYDGVLAISESAKRYAARFGGDAQQLQNTIHNIFVKYEFAALNSNGQLMRTEFMGPGSSPAAEPQSTASKKKSWGCGDIAMASSKSAATGSTILGTLFFALLLSAPLLVPFLSALTRRAVRIPVLARVKKIKN